MHPTIHQLTNKLATYTGERFLPNAAMNALNRLKNPITAQTIADGKLPDASVLILISDEPDPKLLFTRRSNQLAAHAGEVSLVGGKRDLDETPTQAVLREMHEEVGLTTCQLLGSLPMQLSKANLLVEPFVGIVKMDELCNLSPNADEIERVFWVSLGYFLNTAPTCHHFGLDNANKTHPITNLPDTINRQLETPAWIVDNEVIWGMTGRILASFLDIGFGIQHDWYYRVKPLANHR